jgi:WD40 repeat protein
LKRLQANLNSARTKNAERALLLVDQFEEVFTLCRDELERITFIEKLLSTTKDKSGKITIVIALRADFYSHCAQYPLLRQAVAAEQEYIGQMTAEELRRAIEEPAKRGGWEFEAGLIDTLLNDIGAKGLSEPEPGALPLLSHALLATWERRRGRTFTLNGYHASGGVRGAIAETAESVFNDQLNQQQQELARDVFLRLTELGEGTEDTRRRAALNELVRQSDEATQLRAVLNTLAEARLITLNEDSAEVAHEALIREWQRLHEWLTQDRESLLLHRHLTESAREWEARGHDPAELYRGARLAQAREWASANEERLNVAEQTFLAASVDQEQHDALERETQRQRELETAQKLAKAERQRAEEQAHAATKLRKRAVFLGVSFLLSIALAGVALFLSGQARQYAVEADQQRDAAQKSAADALAQKRIATSRELAATALANLGEDAQRSVLLALEAVRTTQEQDKFVLPEAEDALHRALLAARAQLTLGPGEEHVVRAIYSPDNSQIATRTANSVRVWNARTGRELFQIPVSPPPLELRLRAARGWDNVVYRFDGLQLASIDPDVRDESFIWVKIFDAHSGKLVRQTKIPMTRDEWVASNFTHDLAKVVVASSQNIGGIWDTRTGRLLASLTGNQPAVLAVSFSPDEKRILTTSRDGSTKVWNATNGKELLNLCCHLQPVYGAAFSPDGSKIATASGDQTAKIWDANTGKELMILSGLADQVTNVAFSPDGKQIAGSSWDHTTLIWDSESGNQLYRLTGHTDVVEDVSFSPDGKHIVTASDDGSAIIWDAEPSHEVSAIAAAPIWRSSISQDGNRLATRHSGNEFIVWDIAKRQPILTFNDADVHQVDVMATLAISPDGKSVVYATENSIRVWDVASGKQVLNLAPANKDTQPSFVGVPSFSTDGKRILGIFDYPQIPTGVERHAVIWDSMSGARLADFVVAKGNLIGGAIAMSPDGARLVVGDSSSAVRVLDVKSGESLSEEYNDSFVVHVAISPDGKQYAAASIDGTAVVRDMATGKVLFPPLTQSATIYQLEYSPNGKHISTAGFDGVAKVWDASTGKELHSLQGGFAQVRGAHFSADGTHLITTGMDGVIREYTLNIEELVALAKARLTRSLTTEECKKYLHMEQCPNEP